VAARARMARLEAETAHPAVPTGNPRFIARLDRQLHRAIQYPAHNSSG
jgi:hypothetical protein